MAEIPGYYYDEEKKRYFRSPPKHLAYMVADTPSKRSPPTSLTHGSHQSSSSNSKVCTHATRSCRLASAAPRSMFGLTARVSRLPDPFSMFRYALPQAVACSSRRHKVEPTAVMAFLDSYNISRKVSHVVLNQGGNMAISSLWHRSQSMLFVSEISFVRSENRVKMQQIATETFHSYPHIAPYAILGPDVCVAPCGDSEIVMDSNESGVLARLYTPISRRVIDEEAQMSLRYTTTRVPLSIPNIDALTCTWQAEEVLGATSSLNGKIYIFDLPHPSMETYDIPNKSSVLSLLFRQSPLLLHGGTRSGTIATWDLRSKRCVSSTAIPNCTQVNPSVIQMHALDNNYLIANCLNSKLLLWDCRMNRQVLSYPKHSNSYRSCRSCVDNSQSFLAAVGEDKAIRIWSLWRGTLLRTIGETEYVTDKGLSDGELPAITYTDCLGGPGGIPALLIATHEGFTPFSI